jgi:glycosyltransferase involved in cell wall biosynthesis
VGHDSQTHKTHLNATCIYYSSLSDWRGGAAGLKSILKIFDKLGVKTTDVISYSYDSSGFGVEQVTYNSLLNSVSIHFPSHIPRPLKAFSLFFGLIYSWRPIKRSDFVFAHLSLTSGIPAIILGKAFGKPVIFHHIDMESLPIVSYLIKYVLRTADAVLAVSPYLTEEAKRHKFKNVIFLPPTVNTNLFRMNLISRKEIRKDLGVKNGDTLIGYIGAFSFTEGIQYLLQAVKNLSKKHPNVKLLIVGGKKGKKDDDVPQLVEKLGIQTMAKIVPPQPHGQVPRFLSACDIVCCPKIDCEDNRVALPIKVIEYLSMGIPSVCSSVGGISYVIDDGVDGFLVKPGDIKCLERKLEWVISNPGRAKEVGDRGRKKVVKEYGFDSTGRVIQKAIKQIVKKD